MTKLSRIFIVSLITVISFSLTGCLTPQEKIKYQIKSQIERDLDLRKSSNKSKNCKFILHIMLNRDGSVKQVYFKDGINLERNFCKSKIEDAINSVWKSSPFKALPEDQYGTWKKLNFLFDLN